MVCSGSSWEQYSTAMELKLGWCVWVCKVQIAGKRHTYHSALDSARAELALLPAAAEAKEVGAIVVVVLAWEVAVGRIDAFEGHRTGCGTRISGRGSCGRAEICQAVR